MLFSSGTRSCIRTQRGSMSSRSSHEDEPILDGPVADEPLAEGALIDLDPTDYFQHIEFNTVAIPEEEGDDALREDDMTRVTSECSLTSYLH